LEPISERHEALPDRSLAAAPRVHLVVPRAAGPFEVNSSYQTLPGETLMHRFILSLSAALAVSIASSPALAVTHTWNATTGNSMSNSLHWIGGAPVSASANLTLVFPNGSLFSNPNQDIANPLVVQDLQFTQTSFSYQLIGGDYRLDNLGAAPSISVGNQATAQIFSSVEIVDPTIATLGVQSQLALSSVDFSAATTFNMSDQSNLFFDAVTGGSFTVNANATSFANLINFGGTTPNSMSGTANLNGHGSINLNKPANVAALGGNVIVSSASQFQTATINTFNANQFAAGTNLSLVNFGGFNVNGAQTINDFELSSGGNAFVNSGAALTVEGSITSNGGMSAINGFQGTVDFDGQFKTINTTANGPNDLLTFQSAITNGRVNKTGPGKLHLTSNLSTFSGQNEVNGGTLIGTSATIGNVLNNSVVQLAGFGDVLTANQITGPGQVVVTGQTEYQVAQGYTGGTVLQFGLLKGTTATLLGNISGTSGGALMIDQLFNGTFSGTLSGSPALLKLGTGNLSIGGNNPYSGGTSLQGGGLDIQSDTAIGTGPLGIFGTNPAIEATGTRTLSNPLQINSSYFHVGSGNLTFTDTTPKVINGPTITHNSTGSTTIDGKFTVGVNSSIVVNSGQLTLGDPTLVGGFSSAGQITVNGGTLTVRSLNFTTLPDVLLAGGTLDAPNGYAIPLGAALQGTGNVTGRISTANGSTIIATGAMGLGDFTHPAGVNLDGELYTNQYIVGLSDSNQAVLGSYTDIGTATQDGMLSAGNGFVLNFGRNIVGRGTIQSNNLLNAASIINGSVNGDSVTDYLEFTGYVKGVGTFNNVAFSGTFSPGLSPTLLTVGNTILTPSNVLDMELGGLARGGQYDAFDISNGSSMQLDGELQVTLINAFNPSLGDQFLLFQGLGSGTFGGTFDNFDFPALNPGLAWDTSLLYSNGILQVVAAVPEPASLLPVALLCGLFLRRRAR
jgi:fibronectin-binding autotransporter adhesin